jgi:hypothetical protein
LAGRRATLAGEEKKKGADDTATSTTRKGGAMAVRHDACTIDPR